MNDKEVKVNIFDMAGHPVFYEVRETFIYWPMEYYFNECTVVVS